MPSNIRSLESAILAIEAAGWRWSLNRRPGSDPRFVAAGLVGPDEIAWQLRIETGDHAEGRHATFTGPRLTTVLAAALVHVDRTAGSAGDQV